MAHSKILHILLIDDDEDEYVIIRDMLSQNKKINLTWCNTYESALSYIQNHTYDIYLVDYRLGEKDGLSLLQDPIVETRNTPAIILTGQDSPEVDEQALQMGVADYLTKAEISPTLLERSIRYAIRQHTTINQLRQSEKRYKAIVDHQTNPLVRFDKDFKLTFVNQTYCDMRQQDEASLLNTDALATVKAKSRETVRTTIQFLNEKDPTNTQEIKTDADDEQWHHWSTRAIFDGDGQLHEYQSMIRDITERKKVEQELNSRINELRTLRRVDGELTDNLNLNSVMPLALDSAMRLSAADVAIMALYDENSNTLNISQAYGIANLDEVANIYHNKLGIVGRVFQSKQPEHIPDMTQDADCMPSLPKIRSQIIVPMISQDQFLGIISLETARPDRFTTEIFEFIQLVTARIAVALDNARLYAVQRKQLEELQQLYEQVSELEQLKTDMIRIASHDLRNPIGIMQGYIEILQMDVQQDMIDMGRLADQLQAMAKVAKRMRKITTDILSVDRIEQSAEISQDAIDLTLILKDVCDEQAYFAESKNQTYDVHLPDVPTFIHGDYAQIREAAANLIGNAIKYTPEGGNVTVTLECDGDAAIFEVIDTGYGIPYEMQSRLFQPFYRAKTRETNAIEGTGLGLHLVKNIVERHKGRMIFRSRYKEGSTFGFQIPVPKSQE